MDSDRPLGLAGAASLCGCPASTIEHLIELGLLPDLVQPLRSVGTSVTSVTPMSRVTGSSPEWRPTSV